MTHWSLLRFGSSCPNRIDESVELRCEREHASVVTSVTLDLRGVEAVNYGSSLNSQEVKRCLD